MTVLSHRWVKATILS